MKYDSNSKKITGREKLAKYRKAILEKKNGTMSHPKEMDHQVRELLKIGQFLI